MKLSDKFRNERKIISSTSESSGDGRKVKKAKTKHGETTSDQPKATGEDKESIAAHIRYEYLYINTRRLDVCPGSFSETASPTRPKIAGLVWLGSNLDLLCLRWWIPTPGEERTLW